MNDTKVEKITSGNSNCYMVYNDSHAILIDTGSVKTSKNIIRMLERIQELPQISLIIITHTHYDHVNGLHALLHHTGAKVLVHTSEADNLRMGYTPMPMGTVFYSKIISWFGRKLLKRMSHYHPEEPTITFEDTFDLQSFGFAGYVIHTPGHTKGSSSIIIEDSAFIGDTMFGISKKTAYPPFANDEIALLKSWEKLLDTGAKLFYPGHGFTLNKEIVVTNIHKKIQ